MTRAGRHVPRDREIRRRRAATRARVDADGRVRLPRRAHPVARGKIVVRRRGRHAPPGGTEANPGLGAGAMPWAASRSIATSSSSPMAKPGNIKEHALLRDWMFEDMGIAKPGSQPRKLRPGAIAVKCGMTAEWNEHGVRVPLTVLWIDDCRVRPSPSPRLPRVSPCPQPRSSRTRRASIAARPIDRSVNPRNTPSASSPPRAVRRHGRQQLTTFHPAPIAQVTQVKTEDKEGYTALQMGAGSKKAKRLSRQERGHFSSNELPFSAKLTEFRVSPDAILPVGTTINASHFAAGQHVDIQGHTIGKGFQGPMKRWGFSGLPATHGKFILIIVWAISLMSCFVYRDDEEAPRARFHRQLAGSRSGLEREEDGGADG